jgi:flagellar hook-associated protein 2
MAGVIQVGGLASGLDTNTIIDKLVAIERRPIALLEIERDAVRNTRASIDTFTKRLSVLREAATALRTPSDVLVRKASSSNADTLSATAGSGAAPGTVTLNVTSLARVSIAGASVGLSSASSTVATGAGTLRFQVGTGDVVSVDVSDTTTLSDLVSAINAKEAGVTATAVNLGTGSAPQYRLQLVTQATGAGNTISILGDDTTLAIGTTQTGANARFTVSGFSGTFERETNAFSDVLPGVAISLKGEGTARITVENDTTAITAKGKALADAYNEIVRFVDSQSAVTATGDGEDVVLGSLATDGTVRRVVDGLREALSVVVPGTEGFVNASGVGFATQRDGTVAFDAAAFTAALGENADAVAALFGGVGTTAGAADRLAQLADEFQATGGVLAARTSGLDRDLKRIETDLIAGERNLVIVRQQLESQFTALESLVSGLQQQSNFLTNALRGS